MTASPRLTLLCVLMCALAMAPEIADAAEKVRWPIAWKAGEVARYDSESVMRETENDAANVHRITDRTEIRTAEAGVDGYALVWTTHDSRVEAVEGDRNVVDMIAPVLDELDGFEVVIELDRDGHYRRVRNVDAIAIKLRTAMKPVFASNIQRMVASAHPKLSKYDIDAMLAVSESDIDASLDAMVSAPSVETMVSGQAKAMTAFVGKPLTVGKRYRDDAPMESPRNGLPLPARREYALSLVEGDPTLARIRWTRTLDPRGDAKMLWALVDELVGGDGDDDEAPVGDRDARPSDLTLNEEGVVVFNRKTGVVEMMETVEISRYGKAHDEHERYRMRRIGSARTWAQEAAAAKP